MFNPVTHAYRFFPHSTTGLHVQYEFVDNDPHADSRLINGAKNRHIPDSQLLSRVHQRIERGGTQPNHQEDSVDLSPQHHRVGDDVQWRAVQDNKVALGL